MNFHSLPPYPLNLSSALIGKLAGIKAPRCILQLLLRWFVGRYQVNMTEAEKPLSEYTSFNGFFTRNLRSGSRSLPEHTDRLLLSPVDGRLREAGELSKSARREIKGIGYALTELVGGEAELFDSEQLYFVNLYLAPGDYHHVHAPFDCEIVRRHHIPGALWPVNDWALTRIPDLFVKNERVVLTGRSEFGRFHLVMVGAANVGSIKVPFDPELVTNKRQKRELLHRYSPPISLKAGDRLGTFQLGSSVLLVMEHRGGSITWKAGAGEKTRYGQILGIAEGAL